MDRIAFERLVDMALMDGMLTEQEQRVLIQRASEAGISPDELQIIIDAKMQEKQLAMQKEQAALNQNQILASTISSALKSGNATKGRPAKCPHCGAPLDVYSSKCSQCGADIEEREEPRGMDIGKFSEMLAACGNVEEMVNIIKYAVIPATKTGLFDFCSFLSAQYNIISEDNSLSFKKKSKIRNAWMGKVNELATKADLVLKNDHESRNIIERMINAIKNTHEELRKNSVFFYSIKYFVILLGIVVFFIAASSNSQGTVLLAILIIIVGGAIIRPRLFSKFLKL